MSFTLANIRSTIRNVTGSFDTVDFPDSAIDDYINKYYQYVLVDDMKPFPLLVNYQFNTVCNQVTYPFDLETYVSLEPPVFLNGNQLLYYQSQGLWIQQFQYQYNQQSPASTDGVTQTYSGIVSSFPIVPGTFIAADVGTGTPPDQLEQFKDNGDGTITGSLGGVGTIDYTTGAWSITFDSVPPSGLSINITSAPIINGRPRAVYYDGAGTITFSPIPDQSYTVQCQAYIMPTAFIAGGAGTQTPQLAYWGYTIAYGTSLEIFRQRGQFDQLNTYRPEYEKYLDLAQSRTTQQYSNQRGLPKW